MMGANLSSATEVARSILVARGLPVMLDADLAVLYAVSTKALNQAVKRNLSRFPADFAFRLDAREAAALWKLLSRKHSTPSQPEFDAFGVHRTWRNDARYDSA